MRRSQSRKTTLLAVATALAACGGGEAPADRVVETPVLGPVDGRELPGTDLDRIRVGDPAPDFALASLGGGVVRLSELRGSHEVILVFYRGHW
ncbi:MAG TPA: hypothetical protein VLA43_16150 [Longimicrobiales bacterium]|nr:hypothetical protein [Longimicrobiales bacterium]